jgi:hypothetical protein
VNGVSGTIKTGMTVTGGSTLANTKIVSQTSGTTGGVGQYKLNKPQSFLNVSPTTVTPVGVYTSVPVKSTTKSGSGALLKVTIASPSAPYSGATIAVTNPGKNYNISPPTEQLTIDGSYLGGDSVTNDLVVNLASVNNSFYDENDIIVSTASQDRCGKRLTSCRIRFGSRALPFGGFPSAGLYGKPI